MTAYFDELCSAMTMLSENPGVVFLGQAVACAGTAMSRTFRDVPASAKIEFPVAEDMQMGVAIGMALRGVIPVCVYPRWNFLLLATSQLVLHLDKLPLYSAWRPKVIIRTAIAAESPLNPGPQHLGDFTDAFDVMLRTVRVRRPTNGWEVRKTYEEALASSWSTLIVENARLY